MDFIVRLSVQMLHDSRDVNELREIITRVIIFTWCMFIEGDGYGRDSRGHLT